MGYRITFIACVIIFSISGIIISILNNNIAVEPINDIQDQNNNNLNKSYNDSKEITKEIKEEDEKERLREKEKKKEEEEEQKKEKKN